MLRTPQHIVCFCRFCPNFSVYKRIGVNFEDRTGQKRLVYKCKGILMRKETMTEKNFRPRDRFAQSTGNATRKGKGKERKNMSGIWFLVILLGMVAASAFSIVYADMAYAKRHNERKGK